MANERKRGDSAHNLVDQDHAREEIVEQLEQQRTPRMRPAR